MPGPTAASTPLHPADRLHGLLDAHDIVTSDLSLEAMLTRIVEQACHLVGARHGKLRVAGPDRVLERSVRFPDGPPRAASWTGSLDVPIVIRGEVFGSLFLSDPSAPEFTVEDEKLVTAFAALASTAIANAQLYEDARRTRDWLLASGEVARTLLAGGDVDTLLDVVSRALEISGADYGGLILPIDDGQLQVTVTVGVGASYFHGLVFDPVESPLGRSIIAGRSLLVRDMTTLANEDFENVFNYGPMMLAPLVDSEGVRGAVLLMRTADRPPFHRRELANATTFADQVALALQLDDARADAEFMHVLEDRQRIGDDLHDNVIQRLFATGVGLQRLAEHELSETGAGDLRRHINELDDTIAQIRERVFGLRSGFARTPPARRFPRVTDPDRQDRGDSYRRRTRTP